MSCELSFSITLSAEDTLRRRRPSGVLCAGRLCSMPRRAAPANRNRDRLNEIRPSDAERSANPAILLAPDLDALFRQGQRRLRQKAALAHVL